MSLPSPPVALVGHCSAIYNSTLYTYQWNAFQSIPLGPNATWTSLPRGVAVNGSQCVLGRSDGQDALWVVGGNTDNATDANYPGLQRWLLRDKRWASLTPGASVTQNRIMHGAAWLDTSASILVYAGFQDDKFEPSSQTFTLRSDAPYTMRSFSSRAPPVQNPLLVRWNASHAVLVGGDNAKDKTLWAFGEATGWQPLNTRLAQGISDGNKVKAAVLHTPESKTVLETFDLGKTPAQVTPLFINSDQGSAPTRLRRQSSSDRGSLPPYNDTFAPSAPRNGFSLATDPFGLVVISGGTSSPNDPALALFNQSGNSWVNASEFFGVTPTSPNTLIASSTPSSTAAATSAAAAASEPGNSSGPNESWKTILGAVLGGLFGLAALLVVAWLLFRRRRGDQRRRAAMRHGSPMDMDKEIEIDAAGAGAGRSRTSSFGNAGALPGAQDHQSAATRADQGWSRYFVNSNLASEEATAEGVLGASTGPARNNSLGDGTDTSSSVYDAMPRPARNHPAYNAPALPPPLHTNTMGSRSATPSSPESDPENLMTGRTATRPWDPVRGSDTPPLSDGTSSSGGPRPGDFPVPGGEHSRRSWGLGNSWRKTSTEGSSGEPPAEPQRRLRSMAGRELVGPESRGGATRWHNFVSPPTAAARTAMNNATADATRRTAAQGGGASRPEDMSWLNLGR